MSRNNIRLILVFLAAVPIMILLAGSASALCCNGTSYKYGVCANVDGKPTWFEGCQFMQHDGSVVVYAPGTIISPCLKCECSAGYDTCNGTYYDYANIHCQWQPSAALCDVCHKCVMEWADSANRSCVKDKYGYNDPTNSFGMEYYHPLSLDDPRDVAPNGSNCVPYVNPRDYPSEFNKSESCEPHTTNPTGAEPTCVCGRDNSVWPYCCYGNSGDSYAYPVPYPRFSAHIGPGGSSSPYYACNEACYSVNEDGNGINYIYALSTCSVKNQTWCNGTSSGVSQWLDRDTNKTVCEDKTGCRPYSWLNEGMSNSNPAYKFGGYGDGLNRDSSCFPYRQTCLECCGNNPGEVAVNSARCIGVDGRAAACCQSPLNNLTTCAWSLGGNYFCTPKSKGENRMFNLSNGSVSHGCNDGVDNDCDGYIDGADPDCFGCSAGTLNCDMACPSCALGAGNCTTYKCAATDTCAGSRDQCKMASANSSCPTGYLPSASDSSACDLSQCGDQAGKCCTPNTDECSGSSDVCFASACPLGYVAGDDSTHCDLIPGDQAGKCCKRASCSNPPCVDTVDTCNEGICMAQCQESCTVIPPSTRPANYTNSILDKTKCDLNAAGDQAGVCCVQVPECLDGCDNDGNGCKDFPTDSACSGGPGPICSGGLVGGGGAIESGGHCLCNQNGICEVGESCRCSDCANKQDSCMDGLVCDIFRGRCECPIETYMLYNGTCGSATVPYKNCDYDNSCGAHENLTSCEDCAPSSPVAPYQPALDPHCNYNNSCEIWNKTGGFEVCSCLDCKFTKYCMPKACVDDGVCSPSETCECKDCSREARCTAQCDNDGVCDPDESCTCSDCANLPAASCISGTVCQGFNCTCLPQLETCADGTCRTDCDVNSCLHETFCFDGIDNDGDGYTDYLDPARFDTDSLGPDPDCMGIINGTISNETGGIIKNATIHALGSLSYWGRTYTYVYNTTTNETGRYELHVNAGTTYDITITYPNYSPGVNFSVYVDFFGVTELNYTLRKEVSTCNSQCTRGTSNVCDATCHGWNGCMFPSKAVMDLCDPPGPDAHTTEHTVDYNSTHEVRCCTGVPQPKVGLKKAVLNVNSENVVVVKRIVILNGKPVTMHVAVFD